MSLSLLGVCRASCNRWRDVRAPLPPATVWPRPPPLEVHTRRCNPRAVFTVDRLRGEGLQSLMAAYASTIVGPSCGGDDDVDELELLVDVEELLQAECCSWDLVDGVLDEVALDVGCLRAGDEVSATLAVVWWEVDWVEFSFTPDLPAPRFSVVCLRLGGAMGACLRPVTAPEIHWLPWCPIEVLAAVWGGFLCALDRLDSECVFDLPPAAMWGCWSISGGVVLSEPAGAVVDVVDEGWDSTAFEDVWVGVSGQVVVFKVSEQFADCTRMKVEGLVLMAVFSKAGLDDSNETLRRKGCFWVAEVELLLLLVKMDCSFLLSGKLSREDDLWEDNALIFCKKKKKKF